MGIEIRGVSKRFGNFQAVNNVTLSVPDGELLALLGPSGSGKTTLLRIIAGLEFPDTGSIALNGEDATNVNAGGRRVGFVFQHYALFRHMTVFENVAFGLRIRPRSTRPPKAEIRERVMTLLKLVQLDWQAERFPSQLSGGQRQRIALARALAVEPKVLLLDEPFGALDARVRKELRVWLRRLHDEINVACVFVTHDQEEALEVSDRVAIMDAGKIEQIGAPQEVYDRPANPFVFGFLGNVNLFHGRVERGKARLGSMELDAPEHPDAADSPAVVYARPHQMEIFREKNAAGVDDAIEAVVSAIQAIGSMVKVQLERSNGATKDTTLTAEIAKDRLRELDLRVGDRVYVRPTEVRVFLTDHTGPPLDFQI